MPDTRDAVVIGAGLNGLAAAALLRKAGRRVLVLEAAEDAGGSAALGEFHPGFRAGTGLHWSQPMDPGLRSELGLNPETVDGGSASLVSLLGDGALVLRPSIAATARELQSYSPRDAGQWEAFCRLSQRLAGFLAHLYRHPAPRLTSTAPRDLLALLGLGRRARGLGREGMIELLRVMPMAIAEWLDDWFELDGLKGSLGASGITGLHQGPRSAGTAFLFLHHQVGRAAGSFQEGSSRDYGRELLELTRRLGAEIRLGARVARIAVRDGVAHGVILETGEEIAARQVLSTADPRRTLLDLVSPTELAPEVVRAVGNIRFRAVMARLDLALAELPRFRGVEPGDHAGVISLSPSLDYLERAYDDAKHGGISRQPYLQVRIPSLSHPELAPTGRHVMSVWIQYVPLRLKQGEWNQGTRTGLRDLVVKCLAEYAPALPGAILGERLETPVDFEAAGMTGGDPGQGEMGLDQVLFMRPLPGWAHYRTPVPGLFLGGAGCHPGPGLPGAAGRLAAGEMVRAGKERWERTA